MDEFIIAKHNAVVKPSDHWYCLGDVTMARSSAQKEWFVKLIKRMHGHKRLIMGNHDHFPMKVYLEVFEKVMAMQRFENLWFTHVPVHPTNIGSAIANVHGHIHQAQSPHPMMYVKKDSGELVIKPYINISVEAINYVPKNLAWIQKQVAKVKKEWT